MMGKGIRTYSPGTVSPPFSRRLSLRRRQSLPAFLLPTDHHKDGAAESEKGQCAAQLQNARHRIGILARHAVEMQAQEQYLIDGRADPALRRLDDSQAQVARIIGRAVEIFGNLAFR